MNPQNPVNNDTPHPPTAALPQVFRDLTKLLEPLAAPHEASLSPTAKLASRCMERLQRDLLPRTAGAHEHLVAGIVGPNNAGKSLLFNSLVGNKISPSEPRGGATRCLIGATSFELASALQNEPSLAQFPLVPITFEGAPQLVERAGKNAEDPAELLLVLLDNFPPDVLLIDAPDFDSILTANRAASESLLQVADLALVVVTRHTYHNELVVRFLENWLRHGRPWALIYNEAYEDENITAEHAASLATKLGSAPVAVFLSPFDIELQHGNGTLQPIAITPSLAPQSSTSGGLAPTAKTPLATWLFGEERRRLKARALLASSDSLRTETDELVAELRSQGEMAVNLLEAVAEPARIIGREVAGRSMPPGPFLEAFRRVADRRIAAWRRHLRGGTRKLRLAIEGLSGKFSGASDPTKSAPSIADMESIELAPEIGPFLEVLGRRLTARADFWPSTDAGTALTARVTKDLAQAASHLHEAVPAIQNDERLLDSFETVCEELIEAELDAKDRRAGEHLVQFGVDLFHSLPIFAGIGAAIATGGMGADIAAVAAGGLGAAMTERFSKFLGTKVARNARSRWQDLRGEYIADALVARALPTLHAELKEQARTRAATADKLIAILKEIP